MVLLRLNNNRDCAARITPGFFLPKKVYKIFKKHLTIRNECIKIYIDKEILYKTNGGYNNEGKIFGLQK